MNNTIYLGIIGNYKGHLSGAENVAEHDVPNGIFVINRDHVETVTTGSTIKYPQQGGDVDIEPEFVIRCKIGYQQGKVSSLSPQEMTIGNDFTIRTLANSDKISQRKAWGEKSKGINHRWWPMEEYIAANYGDNISLISYIERDGLFQRATPPVTCSDTKLFCEHLIAWVIDAINHQQREGMYEQILPELIAQGYPDELILYTGAPIYTEWGEENFLQAGDKVHIAAFYNELVDIDDVMFMLLNHKHENNQHLLSFMQEII